MTLQISWLWFLNFNYFKKKIERKESEFNFLIIKKEFIFNNNNLEWFLEKSEFEKIFFKKESRSKAVGEIYLGKIPFIFQNETNTTFMKMKQNKDDFVNKLEIEIFSRKNDWEKKFKTQKDQDEFKVFLENFLNEMFFSLN